MKETILGCLFAAGLAVLSSPAAKADQWNQKTIVTFNEPVEIPGHVLVPGTYVFKVGVGDNSTDRNVVTVYNKQENHVYGLFLAIPDYRLTPAGKPIITFDERAAGSPEAVRAWFYPGDEYGHEFVYPKSEAMRLAKTNNRPVASMPDDRYGTEDMKEAHVTAATPSGEEVETITVFGTAPVSGNNR